MGTPIKKTSTGTTVQPKTPAQSTPKKYAVDAQGRKFDVTNIFEEVEAESKREAKIHNEFINYQTIVPDEEFNEQPKKEISESNTNKKTVQQTKKTNKTQGIQHSKKVQPKPKKKKVDPKIQSVFDQIEKNTQQDLKDQEKFMQDMFGDVL